MSWIQSVSFRRLSVHTAQPLSDWTMIFDLGFNLCTLFHLLRRWEKWRLHICKVFHGVRSHSITEPYHSLRKESFSWAFYRGVKQKHRVTWQFSHEHRADTRTIIQTQAWLQSSWSFYTCKLLSHLPVRSPIGAISWGFRVSLRTCVWPYLYPLGSHTPDLKIQTPWEELLRLEGGPGKRGLNLIGCQQLEILNSCFRSKVRKQAPTPAAPKVTCTKWHQEQPVNPFSAQAKSFEYFCFSDTAHLKVPFYFLGFKRSLPECMLQTSLGRIVLSALIFYVL